MKAHNVRDKRDEYFAYGSVLEAVSQGLYPDRKHILREFVQNSYDALGDLRRHNAGAKLHPVEITVSPPSVTIADKGLGMSEETMRRYRYLGFSEKQIATHAGFRGIGKFSAISVCDKLIVRSSKLGDPKSHQVVIDAAAMFKRLQDDKNEPLEMLLREHSQITEAPEEAGRHYTFVELHGIHRDAAELLDVNVIKPYLVRVAPLPFDPAFQYGREISDRLRQVDSRFLEVELLVDGKPIYKPFLDNCSRPGYEPVLIADGSTEPIAFVWFCQNLGKGQFRELGEEGSRGHRHSDSGLVYRVSNLAVGDSMLTRKTLWLTTPERAFYFFGEIHVLDPNVIPTSDRDDFEDTSARGRLYERCRAVADKLSFEAGLQSQQQRFGEVVVGGEELVTETEADLQAGTLAAELKEDKNFQVQKLLEDLAKRLKQSSRSKRKDVKVIRKAKQVLRRAERLHRALKSNGKSQYVFVDISKELKMDSKTKAVYETIISVLREEFRDEPQRFAAVLRRIHEALRKGVPC
ncbi:MAG: ATP-binding protein [Verrucomicrobiia bacterium]